MDNGAGAAPSLTIGDGYAVYRGPIGGGGPIHRHGAFQIVVSGSGEVAMVDLAGTRHQAAALVISPMTPHRIMAVPDLTTYFIEPYCAFADQLRQRCDAGIAAAPDLADLGEPDIAAACRGHSQKLDPRLMTALEMLADDNISMAGLAQSIGISPQRLRALARCELGMPLTRWRVWSRLRRAVQALQTGLPLAQAAVVAGFSDQAHFSRQMREMMGLTPTVVLAALGSYPLRAT